MVSEQLVIDTIKRMRASGIEEETIKETLKEIGLTDKEVNSYLSQLKTAPMTQKNESRSSAQQQVMEKQQAQKELEDEEADEPEEDPDFEDEPEDTAGELKERIESGFDVQDLHNTATRVEMEEQKQRLADIHSRVEGLHTKIDLTPTMPVEMFSQVKIIEKRLTEIEKDLVEIKSTTNGLSSLLKKMIDTNREILNHLEK